MAGSRALSGSFKPQNLGVSSILRRRQSDRTFLTPHGAPPVEPVPAGDAAPRTALGGSSGAGRFVRRELWRAFVEWPADEIRVYDTKTDSVVTFPSHPVPLEPPEQTERRRLWAEERERFREIHPISRDRQIEWMRGFAGATAEPMRTALVLALANEKPFRAFSLAVRADPATNGRWQAERVGRVAEEIENGPKPPTSSPGSSRRRFRTRRASESPTSPIAASSHEEQVRQKVRAAVDRMPLSALYALSIPVEYLVER